MAQLCRSWQSGRFRDQRSAVRIPASFRITHLSGSLPIALHEKDKTEEEEARMSQFKTATTVRQK